MLINTSKKKEKKLIKIYDFETFFFLSFFLFFLDFKLKAGGYMVAFAGRKYAARSLPIMVADDKNTITSFTLVRTSLTINTY